MSPWVRSINNSESTCSMKSAHCTNGSALPSSMSPTIRAKRSLSDRIAVVAGGRIRQLAPPAMLYERPADAFVATFIGESNRFNGRAVQRNGTSARFALGTGNEISAVPVDVADGAAAVVIVRPERVVLGQAASA